MCLCRIVSGNICYVKMLQKLASVLKGKQKKVALFIRIELYDWILSDKSQTNIVMTVNNTEKIQKGFSNFKA